MLIFTNSVLSHMNNFTTVTVVGNLVKVSKPPKTITKQTSTAQKPCYLAKLPNLANIYVPISIPLLREREFFQKNSPVSAC